MRPAFLLVAAAFLGGCASPRPAVVASSAAPDPKLDLFGAPLAASDAERNAKKGEAAPLVNHGEPAMEDSVLSAAEKRVDEPSLPVVPASFVGAGDHGCIPSPCDGPVRCAPGVAEAIPKCISEGVASIGWTGVTPFSRGASAAALGSVSIESCKKDGGPTGSGHVKITFLPSGKVSSAEVDSPPFAGTAVGACIGGAFRRTHIGPFSGKAVTVGKSFRL